MMSILLKSLSAKLKYQFHAMALQNIKSLPGWETIGSRIAAWKNTIGTQNGEDSIPLRCFTITVQTLSESQPYSKGLKATSTGTFGLVPDGVKGKKRWPTHASGIWRYPKLMPAEQKEGIWLRYALPGNSIRNKDRWTSPLITVRFGHGGSPWNSSGYCPPHKA